jgi:putative membrane protein
MSLGDSLARLNAFFNGTVFILLVCGWLAIRAKKIQTHKKLMGSAFIISILFLVSYLTRIFLTGTHRYPGSGVLKTIYLSILLTHTVLAVTIPFLATRAIYLALKNRIPQHRKIARITLPIWMYVSFTGVVIYFMLYIFV